jgi:hypothetical protein
MFSKENNEMKITSLFFNILEKFFIFKPTTKNDAVVTCAHSYKTSLAAQFILWRNILVSLTWANISSQVSYLREEQ